MRRSSICSAILICFVEAAFAQRSTAVDLPKPEDQYVLGPDSQVQAGVPQGRVHEFTLRGSKMFRGFEHHGWLYVPAQYDGKTPIALMVFLDGTSYATYDGAWRATIVLNNLIAKGELPVMAAAFVDPGRSIGKGNRAADGSPLTDRQRTVEYDTLSSAYADFLVSEVMPKVRHHVRITDSPEGRGISGCSSGGIAAFTAAWQRSGQFRKVLSFSGSFNNAEGLGGHTYPGLVRQAAGKPIRVFLQTNVNDDEASNKDLAAALDEQGYDQQFILGRSTHCGIHGHVIFPYAMRWLWRDYP